MSSQLETVIAYHEATKHRFEKYARGPGRMDWSTQPEAFRCYAGAPRIQLDIDPPGDDPSYDSVFSCNSEIAVASLDSRSISRLLYDSMALSAWKSADGVSWPLRINPSSGNLHPTECYLVCGAVADLCTSPMICHYAPKEHELEVRVEIPCQIWEKLVKELPDKTILLGFTSIHWRESWKYGERAYRYCQLDVGHALGAVALAAAALGWEAKLLDAPGSDQLGKQLGVDSQAGAEAEVPDCLLAIFPRGAMTGHLSHNFDIVEQFDGLPWQGIPNRLSSSNRDWERIDLVAQASRKPFLYPDYPLWEAPADEVHVTAGSGSFRRIIRQRRSAVAMDGISSMPLVTFYRLLARTVARSAMPPFNLVAWPPVIDLVLFVHRVDGLAPGLYLLLRNRERLEELRKSVDVEFLWQRPASCPEGLDLYLLSAINAGAVAMEISCYQDIAAEGCFSLGMLAEFSRPLENLGPWFYPRLFWECGMIGQVLYLEAEAAGLRGTGIGCFFDDALHGLLGLGGNCYQDLYHFTVGGAVEDKRLATMPAYPMRQK